MKISSAVRFCLVLGCLFTGMIYSKIDSIASKHLPKITLEEIQHKGKTETLVFVYMAADNNLNEFAFRDIEEMSRVGSNNNLSIIVQYDGLGIEGLTKRLYIGQGRIYEIETLSEKLDFGNPYVLAEGFLWASQNFPAKHYVVILWNHGAGVLDPFRQETRGVCFGDTYNTYLTNQKLEYALQMITHQLGKKLDVVGFDACLMAMIEVADYVSLYADYMIASQQVEPGDGWLYSTALQPLADGDVSIKEFVKHAVKSYRESYLHITKDFTLSALDLKLISALKYNINQLALQLLEAIDAQIKTSVFDKIRIATSKEHMTQFDEPTYIDLDNLYTNLQILIPFMELKKDKQPLLVALKKTIDEGLALLSKVVIANVRGIKVILSSGLSIYFPTTHIGGSYELTNFAKTNAWMSLISRFV